MSSNCPTRRFVVLALLGLAGCGFAPIYGGDGAIRQGAYAFETEQSIVGFFMAGQLSQRLGPSNDPTLLITTRTSVSERAAAITSGGDTSRLNVIGTTDWTLTDIMTGVERDVGTVSAFTSYSATGSTIATQSAGDSARARLAVMLADMIVTRIIAAPDA